MELKSIKEIKDLTGKRVMVRVDYNVAVKSGKILETERIERSFATINYLLAKKVKVILISHLGDPGGKEDAKYSLKPIARYLDEKTKKNFYFANDCLGKIAKEKVAALRPGQILLLENLRFHAGEEKNDAKFAKQLAELADIYVNEAFSVCHRPHASVVGIAKYLPAYAGLNLLNEVENLNKLLAGYKKPAVAIIGGVKISTKIKVIENLLKKYDHVLIGGALNNNFLAAKKINIGKSFFEKDFVPLAKKLLDKNSGKLILPLDVRVSSDLSGRGEVKVCKVADLNKLKNKNFQIVDIGSKTETYFESFIHKAQTLVWNGPMGIFETREFSHGTDYIAQKVCAIAKGPAFGVVGGGETIAVLDKLHLKTWPDFVSTAGGAMLEFLEGKVLPGIEPLGK